MKPHLDLAGAKKVHASEYVVRFVFGGVVTVATGVVARKYGPVVGGLFLSFPAILPATLTMVRRHDGRKKAIDDARGARVGSVGLAAFALAVWFGANATEGWVVLLVAFGAWVAANLGVWALRFGREPQPIDG